MLTAEQQILRKEFSYGKIWSVAWPIIIGSAVQTILSVINTAFLSQLGELPLGAGGIAGLVYLTVIMIAWGFGVGSQIVVARRFGEGKIRQVGRTVTHAFIMQWAMALILFLTLFFSRHQLMQGIVKSHEVAALGEEFLRFRLWGLFFAHTNFAFRSFYVGMARTKVITLTTVIMVLTNILFDYLLIFGNCGFPQFGVAGAAISSVIAEFACTTTFIIYTRTKIVSADYRLFSFRTLSPRLMGRLLRTAAPLMLQNFVTMLAWLLFFLIIEKLGEAELAASNIVRSIYLILQIPTLGFSSATDTFVSYVMGQGRNNLVIPLLKRILRFSLTLVISLAAITIILHNPILSIYTKENELLTLARPILWIICTAYPMQAAGMILFSAITGTGKTDVGLWIDSAALVVYLTTAWTLAALPNTTLLRVWYVEYAYGTILTIICILYLKFGHWREAKV